MSLYVCVRSVTTDKPVLRRKKWRAGGEVRRWRGQKQWSSSSRSDIGEEHRGGKGVEGSAGGGERGVAEEGRMEGCLCTSICSSFINVA